MTPALGLTALRVALLRLWVIGLSALALGGCGSAPSEAPPPPRKVELVHAPPHALGARAAGTDAAPKPELGLPVGDDGTEPGPSTEPPPDSSAPDASPPIPSPQAPDGGTAL